MPGCHFFRVTELLKGSAEHVTLTIAKGAAQLSGIALNQPPSPRYPGRKDLDANMQYGKWNLTCMNNKALVKINAVASVFVCMCLCLEIFNILFMDKQDQVLNQIFKLVPEVLYISFLVEL